MHILVRYLKQILLIMIFLITGCKASISTPIPTISNSITAEKFLDLICGYSCWNSIKPGETPIEDANIVVTQSFDINHIRWDLENGEYHWQLNQLLHGGMVINEGIIGYIRFSAEESYIKLTDFIDKFGNPDSYAIIKRVSGDCPSYLSTLYFYHEEGIVLTHIICNDPQKYKISKEYPITYIYIFPVGKVDSEISAIYSYDLGENTDIRSIQQPIPADEVID